MVSESHWSQAVYGSRVLVRRPERPLYEVVEVKPGCCGETGGESREASAKESYFQGVVSDEERHMCCRQQSWRGGAI